MVSKHAESPCERIDIICSIVALPLTNSGYSRSVRCPLKRKKFPMSVPWRLQHLGSVFAMPVKTSILQRGGCNDRLHCERKQAAIAQGCGMADAACRRSARRIDNAAVLRIAHARRSPQPRPVANPHASRDPGASSSSFWRRPVMKNELYASKRFADFLREACQGSEFADAGIGD